MRNIHVTDEEIQSRLEMDSARDGEMDAHIRFCAVCRERFRQYRILFHMLDRAAPPVHFPADFAESVLKRIPRVVMREKEKRLTAIVLSFAGVVITAVFMRHFGMVGPFYAIAELIKSGVEAAGQSVLALFGNPDPFRHWMAVSLMTLAFAFFMDYLIRVLKDVLVEKSR